ncbi:MAG: hydrogenase small subunit [Thermoleophilia bacterium]
MEHEEMSLFPGLSRRDFLKTCGALAAVIGLSGPMAAPKVANALQQLAKRPSIVWSCFQECLGCSVNLLQMRKPGPANLILQQISLDYHEAVMAAAGSEAKRSFHEIVDSKDFYYIVEGGIATGIPDACTIGGMTSMEMCKDAYQKAKATIAIGTCACYGGIQAAKPNPTGAKGVADFLREDAGIKDPVVINSPRCPGNADDTVAILLYVLVKKQLPELDDLGRPKFLFGHLIHDDCDRRGHFDAGEFVEQFGDEGSANNWCLYKVGCKGPVTYGPCPKTRYNGNVSWPVAAGGPCIGCSEPDFWDKQSPFYEKAPGIRLPGDITPTQVGVALGAATAVGIGAHFVGQAATGRLFKGAPVEGKEEEPGSKEGGK